MTWIESFPIPGSRGRYLFFVEFVGHQSEPRARRAIATLAKKVARGSKSSAPMRRPSRSGRLVESRESRVESRSRYGDCVDLAAILTLDPRLSTLDLTCDANSSPATGR